jgi:N,N-dimethylformamidase
MYLGGNGFYWVTSVHRDCKHVIEVRRGHAGSRAWESEPGELHHSTTGELGGLWRHRGTLPNRLLGVGFAAEGVDVQPPAYHRLPRSYEARYAWIFDGVENESFGIGGFVLGGAAGDEVDRADVALGTPAETAVLASARDFGSAYAVTLEDQLRWRSYRAGGEVRSDMTITENDRGGAVFAVGSISWAGALSHREYDNHVARITTNVLQRFMQASGK